MSGLILAALIIFSYLIGSINFSKILTKKKEGYEDFVKGNPGTTNMLRNYGAKLALITLLLDILKGLVPALIGYLIFLYSPAGGTLADGYTALYACGLAAIIGHIFPIYYRFRGGKAGATAFGVFLVAQPVLTLVFFVFCFSLASITKLVSLSTLLFVLLNVIWANIFMPEFTVILPTVNIAITLLTVAIGAAVFGAHWFNIANLVRGKEHKTDIWGKLTEKLAKNKQIVNTTAVPSQEDANKDNESKEKTNNQSNDSEDVKKD